MAPRGTRIDGWWVWWPCSGSTYARVFSSEEDARTYCPLGPSKVHGKAPPLGPKLIQRVSWNYETANWSGDEIISIPQEEVWAEYFATQEAV